MITLYNNLYLSIDDRDVIDEINRLEEEDVSVSVSIPEWAEPNPGDRN